MSELIDRQALDNAFTSLRFKSDGELAHWGDRKDWCLHGSEIEKLIADAPTIDAVEVVHGEWEEENRRPRSTQFVCSVCHRTAYDPQPTRDPKWVKRCRYAYCPNCGARMDGERREGE